MSRSGQPPSATANLAMLLKQYPVLGQPLYTYRVSDQDYQRLQIFLQQVLPQSNLVELSSVEAAALCLFGAEWWRRRFTGGYWSWDNLLSDIGVSLQGSVAVLYPTIHKGLGYWGRHVRSVGNRNVFLATLAIEGGLPLQLIRNEGQWLRRYLRGVLEQYQTFYQVVSAADLARDLGLRLPVSLRHEEIYYLVGRLIEEIHERAEGWEQRLPLSLDDDIARELVNGLVRDVEELRAGRAARLRVATWLENKGNEFKLHRTIELPARIELNQLLALLGRTEGDLPARLHISAQDHQEATWLVAVLTRLFEQDGYAVEPARGHRELRLSARGRLTLKLHLGEVAYGTLQVLGGDALGELPWIFEAPTEGTSALRLLAEGGLGTRRSEVYVATPPESVLAGAAPGTAIEEVGSVVLDPALAPRKVLRLHGHGVFLGGSGDCAIRTSEAEDQVEQHTLRGTLLSLCASPVYVGAPQLWCCREDGSWSRVPEAEIQRTARFGQVRLRRVVRGSVRYQTLISVLPPAATVDVAPGQTGGIIELSGLATPKLGISEVPGVQVQQSYDPRRDRHHLTLTATDVPPPTIQLQIAWGSEAPATLELPFPIAGAWFVDRHGAVLPDGAKVSMAALPTIKLNALAHSGDLLLKGLMEIPYGELRLELRTPRLLLGPVPLGEGRVMQSLGPIHDHVALYFASVMMHDTPVSLVAEVDGKVVRRLEVVGYAGRVESDEQGHFTVVYNDGRPVPKDVAPQIEALPFWEPAHRVALRPQGDGYIIPAPRESGPWIIVARNGELFRCKKDIVPTPEAAVDQPEAPITLRGVCASSDRFARRAAFSRWFAALVQDSTHPEWRLLKDTVRQLHHLPALWFDAIRDLAANPVAVAMTGLYVDSADFGAFFTGLECLPFSFATMPVSAWVRASRTTATGLRQLFTRIGMAPAEQDQAITKSLHNLLELAPRWLRGLRIVAQAVQHHVLGGPPLPREAAVKQAEAGRLHEALQHLFRAHSHEHWIDWPDCRRDLEQIERQAPSAGHLLRGAVQMAQGGYRIPAVAAPVVAAVASAAGITLRARTLFYVRAMSQFDPLWFETAHEIFLSLAIATMPESLTHE